MHSRVEQLGVSSYKLKYIPFIQFTRPIWRLAINIFFDLLVSIFQKYE